MDSPPAEKYCWGIVEQAINGVTRILPAYYEAYRVCGDRLPRKHDRTGPDRVRYHRKTAVPDGTAERARPLDPIIEHLPIGYIQFDHFGFIRRINQTQRRFFQYEYEEGETPFNVINDPFARLYGLDELFIHVMVHNKMLRVEKQLDFSKGQPLDRPEQGSLAGPDPVPYGSRDQEQIVVVLANDTTDRKLERQMRNPPQRNTEQLHLFLMR